MKKFNSLEEECKLKDVEEIDNKLSCPLCWEKEKLCIHQYLWAYDWWLTLECKNCWKQTHRISKKAISEEWQPKEYWPVFFKTGHSYYKNLDKITKEEYEKNSWGV